MDKIEQYLDEAELAPSTVRTYRRPLRLLDEWIAEQSDVSWATIDMRDFRRWLREDPICASWGNSAKSNANAAARSFAGFEYEPNDPDIPPICVQKKIKRKNGAPPKPPYFEDVLDLIKGMEVKYSKLQPGSKAWKEYDMPSPKTGDSWDDLDDFEALTERNAAVLRDKVLMLVLLTTGMRVTQACEIRMDQLDLELDENERAMLADGDETPDDYLGYGQLLGLRQKGNKVHNVPLGPEVVTLLQEWIRFRFNIMQRAARAGLPECDRLFVGLGARHVSKQKNGKKDRQPSYGQPIDRHVVSAIVRRRTTRKDAKGKTTYLLKAYTPDNKLRAMACHDFRRSLIIWGRENGKNDLDMMQITGHTTRSMFDRYAYHARPDGIGRAIPKISMEIED